LFGSQQFAVLISGRELGPKWDGLLAGRMLDLNFDTASVFARRVAKALRSDFDPEQMRAWLAAVADSAAADINTSTRDALALAEDHDGKAHVFELLTTTTAVRYAKSMVATSANFGAHDAAAAAGGERTKTWSGGTTRHGSMNGETVPLSDDFSNGMAWPGDPAGGAAEVANCNCSLTFN
jgi:hypothetical protein